MVGALLTGCTEGALRGTGGRLDAGRSRATVGSPALQATHLCVLTPVLPISMQHGQPRVAEPGSPAVVTCQVACHTAACTAVEARHASRYEAPQASPFPRLQLLAGCLMVLLGLLALLC